ncbi:MAG: TetR/AcrR family transcriptional regulator [Saprospiraceae bacterium]|nr:TetR/AcrR family transcriptional regulator [Saprospiraceae bacterium]
MMDNSETPTTPELPDSTEQRIFDAAHQVFVQKGLDGAKMQEIADHAGINKALLHYYFRTKEKLFEMVAKAVINRAFPAVQQLIEADMPLEQKIDRFVDFYIDLISRNPFVPLFIIGEINKHPDQFFEKIIPAAPPRPERFFRQVEEAVAEGRIRPISPRHLLVNVLSMCVFPIVARPMLRIVMGMSSQELNQFLKERKEEVKAFIFAALRP